MFNSDKLHITINIVTATIYEQYVNNICELHARNSSSIFIQYLCNSTHRQSSLRAFGSYMLNLAKEVNMNRQLIDNMKTTVGR